MKTTTNRVWLRLVLATALAVAPVTASLAQGPTDGGNQGRGQGAGSLTVPVSGTVSPETSTEPGSPLTGTFRIQRFERSGDSVVAVGTLTATFTDPLTNAARTIVTPTAIPLDRAASGGQATAAEVAAQVDDVPLHGPAVAVQPACDILHLVLGPLDLNLLGLRIQLNQVVLDITAVPGAGNLLGNLLCAIVGLLDGPGPLAQLVGLLNQLLAILG